MKESIKIENLAPIKTKKSFDGLKQISNVDQENIYSTSDLDEKETPTFRISLEVGYSYRIAKVSNDVPPVFKSYVEKLKSGYNIGRCFLSNLWRLWDLLKLFSI